jgi:hypothetical protein
MDLPPPLLSVNYGGRWKPLHYVVQKAFAPVAVTAVIKGDKIQVRYEIQARGISPIRRTFSLSP